jgi:Alginate export
MADVPNAPNARAAPIVERSGELKQRMKSSTRCRVRDVFFCAFCSVVGPLCGIANAEQSTPAKPSAEERFWSNIKGLPIGPFKLDLGVGLRLRGEFQGSFNVKKFGAGSHDEILFERARLELGLRISDGFRFFVQGQDAHEFGCNFSNKDFQSSSPYNNHFDLRQAFLEWTRIGRAPLGFKVGRQSISFSDNRLMGPGEWGNVGRYTWDAAALTWRSDRVDVDLFYAFRVQYDPAGFDDRHVNYDVLGLFSTFPVQMLKLHAFYFLQLSNFPSDVKQPHSGSSHRHSAGVSLEGALDSGIDFSAGVIPQFGTWNDTTVMALGGYAVLGYTAPLAGSPRIGLHYAYGSGDSNPADKTTCTFDGLFGAVDKYYGRMNLFAWMNLHDLQLALSGSPMKFIKVSADYHLFLLADKHDAWYYPNGKPQRQDPSGASGRLVGHELDLVVVIKATRHAQIQAGYGLFVPGEFVRHTGLHEPAHWGFLQGSYHF